MAVTARFLIDTSAAARMANSDVAERLAPLIEGGVVASTAAVDAEASYSARGADEYEELWNDRRLAYEYPPTNDEHWQAALNAQRELARAGRHRAVGCARSVDGGARRCPQPGGRAQRLRLRNGSNGIGI